MTSYDTPRSLPNIYQYASLFDSGILSLEEAKIIEVKVFRHTEATGHSLT